MLETTEQVHAPVDLESEMPAAASAMEDETFLIYEISQLWNIHTSYQDSIKQDNHKLRAIRGDLGKLLFHMKQVLAKPGRNGGWSSFLKERQIPRATADRLVIRYQESLNPDANRLNETISEPTEEEIVRLFHSMRPRLRRLLATPQSLYRFIDLLTAASCDGTRRRITDDGILILKSAQQAASAEPRRESRRPNPKLFLRSPQPDWIKN
jgi:hypothetical protein